MANKNLVINYTTDKSKTIDINDLINIERLQQKLSENDPYFHNIIAKIKESGDWKKVEQLTKYVELNDQLNKLEQAISDLNDNNTTQINKIAKNVKEKLTDQYALDERVRNLENIETEFNALKENIDTQNKDATKDIAKYKTDIDKNIQELEERSEKYTKEKIDQIQTFIKEQKEQLWGNPITEIKIEEVNEKSKRKYLKYKMKYLRLKELTKYKN